MGGGMSSIRQILWCAVLALVVCSGGARSSAQFPPAPGTGPGLAETIEAIDAARVTTRILYVTAHPDDESGAVLTYLARGLHANVALLSADFFMKAFEQIRRAHQRDIRPWKMHHQVTQGRAST